MSFGFPVQACAKCNAQPFIVQRQL